MISRLSRARLAPQAALPLRSTPPPHVLKPRRSIVTFDPQAGAQQQVDTPDPGEGDGKGRDKPGRSAVIESALGTMAGASGELLRGSEDLIAVFCRYRTSCSGWDRVYVLSLRTYRDRTAELTHRRPFADHHWCQYTPPRSCLTQLIEGSAIEGSADKYEALRKISNAFEAGWDPVLELASAGRIEASGGARKEGRIRRKEQSYIDKVINGEIRGEYLLLLGPKVSSSRGGIEERRD